MPGVPALVLYVVTMNAGTGPGEITNDGCAVDFYSLLPSFGEAEIVHAAVPEGGSILELGCGTGRILRPLAGLGHPATGVDDSPAMLARAEGLPTVCSAIEDVNLGRTFDAVLLASTMINTEPGQRRRFLAACRRHLGPGGVAVFQQNAPSWFTAAGQAPPVRDDPSGIRRIVRSVRREPPRLFIEVEYQVADQVWTHSWCAHEIGERELAENLASAGLRFGRWLTGDHAWFTAVPAG
jgi:SAM-dependent methyltransferase